MPGNVTARISSPSVPVQTAESEDVQRDVRRLVALAMDGLVPMFDPRAQLFCFKLERTAAGLTRKGLSRRYTMISLMGLHELEKRGTTSPIAIQPVLDGLLANTDWVDNVGDLGLLLWLCALTAPERLKEIVSALDVQCALTRYRGARQGYTMELAWFLAGLAHGSLARPEQFSELRDVAFRTYRLLRKNQSEQGIFGHVTRSRNIFDMLRSRIGHFADQVYPIYALTKFGQAFGYEKATESALDCALAICQAQGTLGQWWWHYDSTSGQAVGEFPVYSVHQHGMAPMALFALGEAIQSDFSPWIYKGLRWIKDNELDFDMEDAPAKLVWRCISRPALKRYWTVIINRLGPRRGSNEDLEVVFECRPYELGWLLYAFAGRDESSVLGLST